MHREFFPYSTFLLVEGNRLSLSPSSTLPPYIEMAVQHIENQGLSVYRPPLLQRE